jgi:hypothetical protein
MRYDRIRQKVSYLKSVNENKRYKMLRNLWMYEYDNHITFDDLDRYQSVGYYWNGETTNNVNENVIRSCVDTLTSKIACQKVRPFFNSVNGSWKDFELCTQAQQFFDILFDEYNVNDIITLAFKDACIFERGLVFISNTSIERMLPWTVYTNPAEDSYNKNTELLWECKKYPKALLPFDIKTNQDLITYTRYWNTKEKVFYVWIPEANYNSIETYEKELPFVQIYYNKPLFGSSCSSVVDVLFGIQDQIDNLMKTCAIAAKRNMPKTYWVPEGTDVKAGSLNNEVGQVIPYRPIPGASGVPVICDEQRIIDPQYRDLIDKYKQDAYELVGISQLSATSQKPQGLNSGIALSTMENIESDRFETQLNQVIRCYVDLAKKCINILDAKELILPQEKTRAMLNWDDLIGAAKSFNIQFSAAESLSKDPSTKLQQLQSLAQAGIIPQSHIAKYLELPDIESAYNITTNALNAVMSLIKETIEGDEVPVIPPYIPIPTLKEECLNMMLSLRGANYEQNKADIDKLMLLYNAIQDTSEAMRPEEEEVPPEGAPTEQPMGEQPMTGEMPMGEPMNAGMMNEAIPPAPEIAPENINVANTMTDNYVV